MRESIKKKVFGIVDVCAVLFSFLYLPLLKTIRRYGVKYFPLHKKRFLNAGVFPIRDHYYEPQINYSPDFDANRIRPIRIDFRLDKQLQELSQLKYVDELSALALTGDPRGNRFYLNNPSFGPGDSDLYYLLLRNFKPKKIIEIGSGFSTLVCLEAIKKNAAEGSTTELVCIEPFEKPWLEKTPGINLIRSNVEKLPVDLFTDLKENDILFIDSSHIIRPENDVLFEYLELLPRLNKGVMIHIHDIFSPRHYPADWLKEDFRFWNEQYLLEAFLYYNDTFEILFTANHLVKDAFQQTSTTLVSITATDEPSSVWLRKIK
jgi:hypothetical protein